MEILVMKQCYKMLLTAVCMAASSYAITVQAADWTIIQSATVTTATPALNQGNTGSVENSTQSINGIALEPSVDNLISGSQTANITASTSFELIQGSSVTGAKQSVNDIVAQNIAENSGDSVTQLVEGASTALKLEQKTDSTGGNENRQALNAAAATGTVNSLQQEVRETGTLRMEQKDIATGENIQSVNFASGNIIGLSDTQKLQQSLSITGSIVMEQGGTASASVNNVQAGNIALGTGIGSQIGDAEQSYTASGGLDISQDVASGTGNTQVLNLADTKTNSGNGIGGLNQDIMLLGGTVEFESKSDSDNNTQAGNLARAGTEIGAASTQSFTKSDGTLTFTMSGSGASNIQAANLARADTNITDLSQTFNASSASLTFNMTSTGASSVQAGNMVVLDGTGTSTEVSGLTQTFTGSNTDNDFIQNTSADHLIQAGNLINLGTGGLSDTTGPHQVFTATGAVDMTQSGTGTGATHNLQALNAVVDTTGGTSAVNLMQTLSATGLSFVLTQNGVADSGQFGNFAGLRY